MHEPWHKRCVVCLMFVIIMSGYTHEPRLDWSPYTYMICLVALHVSWNFMPRCTPRLMILHVSCYSSSRENEDFHGKILNFTCEYLRVTMRGPPCMSEVTLELYRS